MDIQGTIVSGVGKGAHFVGIYSDVLQGVLGYVPFPGTLNVLVSEEDFVAVQATKHLRIDAFTKGDKEYGAVEYCDAIVRDVPVTILLPVRSKHENTIEIIAEQHLKSLLKMVDGDTIGVHI